jgi:RNA polymerase sigma-70 factor (ECF subfamily)
VTHDPRRPGPGYPVPSKENRPDTSALVAFVSARTGLFGIAYRILRDAEEAEDIVQDVWVRWQTVNRNAVRDARAFLATATARLAINRTRSAHWRRTEHADAKLSEAAGANASTWLAESSEALELAVLVTLERLSPAERAAYVLREAFCYEYTQIARTIRATDVNCRQLVARARKHLGEGRRNRPGRAEQRRFLEAFMIAARSGQLGALEVFLASGVSGLGETPG